jgi:acyl-CoA synthetase (NDP forming)
MMDRAAVIDSLISPRSIAIIGASADFSKINGRPMKHLIEKGYAGRILPDTSVTRISRTCLMMSTLL